MRTYIEVRFEFEGFHYYLAAPEEVSFLRHSHRHLFKCRARIEVFHDDRELEFILVKRALSRAFTGGQLGQCSCEMLAKKIGEFIHQNYGSERALEVEVSEDGENGSVVVWP